MPVFAGIDLTCSPKQKSAYALLQSSGNSHRDLHIERLEFLHADSEIIDAIKCNRPAVTGIDAPLSLPKGLCCLNDSCTCLPESSDKGRLCERELARERIHSYFTTKRSIIKDMVHRAIGLKTEFTRFGFEVIEVYPYATKRRLWGNSIPKKTTSEGRHFLKDALIQTIANIREYDSLGHDQYDALIAAYTAYLHLEGLTDSIGDPDEGQIVVPSVFSRSRI